MINWGLRFFLPIIFLAATLSVAQTDRDGVLTGSKYSNDAYRLRVEIPSDWQAAPEILERVRSSVSDPSKVQVWLAMQASPNSPIAGTEIVLRTEVINGVRPIDSEIGKLYVTNAAKANKAFTPLEPFRIMVGGLDMFRTTLKLTTFAGDRFTSLMAIGVRDRIIVFRIQGTSEKAVDEAVRMLMGAVHFQPDWSVPDSELDTGKFRVRVSMGVSQGLLQKKVTPKYPVEAREKHIQGSVVVNALISRKGEVQRIWVVEGPPELAPATVEAVKQWKYKPYLLNGEPVLVETKITSNYELRSTP